MNTKNIQKLISNVSNFRVELSDQYAQLKDRADYFIRKFKVASETEISIEKLNSHIERLDQLARSMNDQDLDKNTQAHWVLLVYLLSHKNIIDCKQDRDRNFFYFKLDDGTWVSENSDDHQDLIMIDQDEPHLTEDLDLEDYEAYDNSDGEYVLLESGKWIHSRYAIWLDYRSEFVHQDDAVRICDDDEQVYAHINDVEEYDGQYYLHGIPASASLISGRHEHQEWQKIGVGACFGIEIEAQSSIETLQEIYNLRHVNSLQEDSSISADAQDEAYEIVSHILSLQEAQNFASKLEAYHDLEGADNGGIHIHISRSILSEKKWDQLAEFMVENQKFFKAVAGRSSHFAKFTHTHNDRYVMLNFTNHKTREIRIYDNNIKNLYVYITFTANLIKYIAETAAYDLQEFVNFLHQKSEHVVSDFLDKIGYYEVDTNECEIRSLERDIKENYVAIAEYVNIVNNSLNSDLNNLARVGHNAQEIHMDSLLAALADNLYYNSYTSLLPSLYSQDPDTLHKVVNYMLSLRGLTINLHQLTESIKYFAHLAQLGRCQIFVGDVYAQHVDLLALQFVAHQSHVYNPATPDQTLKDLIAYRFNLDAADVAQYIPQYINNLHIIKFLNLTSYQLHATQRSYSLIHFLQKLKSSLNYALERELVAA